MSSNDRCLVPAAPTRRLRTTLSLRLSAVALALSVLPAAQAALFEDDEARRAIIELRQRVEANRQAADAAAQRVANQVRDQLREQFREELKRTAEENSPLRRSIIDLQAQIESLRSEVATLRGQNEQLIKILSDTQQRQKDVAQTVEDRLRRFDPVTVSIDGLEFSAEPNEKRDFEAAMALFRDRKSTRLNSSHVSESRMPSSA